MTTFVASKEKRKMMNMKRLCLLIFLVVTSLARADIVICKASIKVKGMEQGDSYSEKLKGYVVIDTDTINAATAKVTLILYYGKPGDIDWYEIMDLGEELPVSTLKIINDAKGKPQLVYSGYGDSDGEAFRVLMTGKVTSGLAIAPDPDHPESDLEVDIAKSMKGTMQNCELSGEILTTAEEGTITFKYDKKLTALANPTHTAADYDTAVERILTEVLGLSG